MWKTSATPYMRWKDKEEVSCWARHKREVGRNCLLENTEKIDFTLYYKENSHLREEWRVVG